MGVGETTGIVFIVVLVLQGLFKVIEKLIEKKKNGNVSNQDLLDAFNSRKCGLNIRQSEQLTKICNLTKELDEGGTPLIYVPRSLSETQKETVVLLRETVNLIEQMYKKMED